MALHEWIPGVDGLGLSEEPVSFQYSQEYASDSISEYEAFMYQRFSRDSFYVNQLSRYLSNDWSQERYQLMGEGTTDYVLNLSSTGARIIFYQGQLSPRFIRKVGLMYKVNPEIFLTHLNLESMSRGDSVPLKVLAPPSCRRHIARIRMAAVIGDPSRTISASALTHHPIDISGLATNISGRVLGLQQFGYTMLRSVVTISHQCTLLEQVVTVTLIGGLDWKCESSFEAWMLILVVPPVAPS